MPEPGPRDVNKSVRLTQEEWARVERAARMESRRLGSRVHPSRLLVEVGMEGVNRILGR